MPRFFFFCRCCLGSLVSRQCHSRIPSFPSLIYFLWRPLIDLLKPSGLDKYFIPGSRVPLIHPSLWCSRTSPLLSLVMPSPFENVADASLPQLQTAPAPAFQDGGLLLCKWKPTASHPPIAFFFTTFVAKLQNPARTRRVEWEKRNHKNARSEMFWLDWYPRCRGHWRRGLGPRFVLSLRWMAPYFAFTACYIKEVSTARVGPGWFQTDFLAQS